MSMDYLALVYTFMSPLALSSRDVLCLMFNSEANDLPRITCFLSHSSPQLVIPEYCKDPVHPDHPTAGWLRRKKRDKRALTSSFVNRFFRLEYDAYIMRYTFSYGE